jgi:hypothetical protein
MFRNNAQKKFLALRERMEGSSTVGGEVTKACELKEVLYYFSIFLPWLNNSSGPRPPHYRGFIITLRHTTVGRTPLDE